MGSNYENQKNIVDAWVKLEKCLDDFDAEVLDKRNRPMTGGAAPNRFQITTKRPDSSKFGPVAGSKTKRPQTAMNLIGRRPASSFSIVRPMTAKTDIYGSQMGSSAGLNLNKVIHSLPLEQVIALYEARCQDNQVDYLESQAKFFIDKFKVACGDRVFDMTEHNISILSARLIAQTLATNDEFIKLELGKNNLTDEGLDAICQLLQVNKNIIHLNVASNNLTEEGARIISEYLVNNNTLISLCLKSFEGLNRNKVGPKGCSYLKKYLTKTKTLMYLDLCASQIGLLGLRHICDGLKMNTSLISLVISHNYLGPNMTKYLSGSLSASSLEELDISYNKLGDQGVASLATLFNKVNRNSIKRLNLSGNNFTSVGLDKFVLELRDNAILEELILDNNNFSGRQITCLANLFSDTQSLKKFSAEKCEMDEFAGESIKTGLMRNMTLLELYLKDNSLYDAGCAFICEALSSNTCLKKIDLSENRFREKSGVAIGSMLKANTTLEDLGLAGNTITEAGGIAMLEGLLLNKVIRKMRLRLNPIGYKYTSEIESLLAANNKAYKKKTTPTLHHEIEELQTFEMRRDSINEELERKKDELREKRRDLDDTMADIAKEKKLETDMTKTVDNRLEAVLERNRAVEQETHNLVKVMNEDRQKHNIAMNTAYKQREKYDKEIQELIRQLEEKKKELHVREVEDKQRIMELQIHIKQQKKDIENDLEHLHTLEKKHNEILNYGKESQLEVDIGAIDSNSPNKHGTFADLNQETSVKGTQERLTTKGGSGKSKQPTKNKIGSRNNLSPSKQSQANLTKLTSKTSLSAQSPPKRPTTAAKVTLKPANKQAKTKP